MIPVIGTGAGLRFFQKKKKKAKHKGKEQALLTSGLGPRKFRSHHCTASVFLAELVSLLQANSWVNLLSVFVPLLICHVCNSVRTHNVDKELKMILCVPSGSV